MIDHNAYRMIVRQISSAKQAISKGLQYEGPLKNEVDTSLTGMKIYLKQLQESIKEYEKKHGFGTEDEKQKK